MAAPLTIGLFGPMRVLVGDQPLPPVRSRKALWLLALLTLRHGRPVAREWLASTLWPDADLSVAFTNLRPVMWELRRALGDQAFRLQSPDRVTVILDLEGADVDLAQFDALVRKGTLEALESALNLYRGPLLEGCPEEWAPQERGSREQDCIQALQLLAETAVASGDYPKAADSYQRLITLDPWRDAPRRGLMNALAKSGDVNAALQVYRNFANLLRGETGLAPDDQTTALYTRLRAQARQRPAPIEAAKTAAEAAEVKVSGYLPHALTPLFGREDERLEVAGLLRNRRLVTLLGPGGIGKTRLAMSIAQETVGEYAGGVWLVALENLSDERLVAGQILATLGVREEAEADPMKSLLHHLRNSTALLVLDNCEHLLGTVVRVCAELLRECGRLRILATSRETLGMMGEKVYAVPALAVPDANGLPHGAATRLRVLQSYEGVQLFVDRAQTVNAGFELNGENAIPVARICERLEGVPLAIEFAAARLKALTLEQVGERLDDHLRLLCTGNRSAVSRQQTLRATLDWSYALLTETERLLLQRLSVFTGGWTLEAAERVAAGNGLEEADISELHTALTDKSMIRFDEPTGRFRLLETVRQYAAEKLGNESEIAMKHRAWALELALAAEGGMKGPDQGRWLDRLESERSNLRTALASCERDPRTGLLLAGSLWRFWYIRGPHSEGSEQMELALARECEDEAARAKALYGWGCLAYCRTDQPLARRCLHETLEIQRRLGNALAVAEALNVLGNIEAAQSSVELARSFYEASLQIRRDLGNKPDIALVLHNFGAYTHSICQFDVADRYLAESLAIYQEVGDESGIGWCLILRSWVCERRADYASAQAQVDESFRLFTKMGDKRGVAWTSYLRARLDFWRGDYDHAEVLAQNGLDLFTQVGDHDGMANCMMVFAFRGYERGEYEPAKGHVERAILGFEKAGSRYGLALALSEMGRLEMAMGETRQAREHREEALRIRFEISDLLGAADTLDGLADVERAQGDLPRAASLLGLADSIRAEIGGVLPPCRQQHRNQMLSQTRMAMGNPLFSEHYDWGRSLSSSEGAAYALEHVESVASVR